MNPIPNKEIFQKIVEAEGDRIIDEEKLKIALLFAGFTIVSALKFKNYLKQVRNDPSGKNLRYIPNSVRGAIRGLTRKLGVESWVGPRRLDRLVRELKYHMGMVWLWHEEGNMEKAREQLFIVKKIIKEEIEDINEIVDFDIEVLKGVLFFGDFTMLKVMLEEGLDIDMFVENLSTSSKPYVQQLDKMLLRLEDTETPIAELEYPLPSMNVMETRKLPANAANAISYEDIQPGTIMVDFKNKTNGSKYESAFSRFYTEKTFQNIMKTKKQNPFTTKLINKSSIVHYKANVAKGGKLTSRKLRKTRKH